MKRYRLSLVSNLILLLLEICGFILLSNGSNSFSLLLYTEDSNLLCALTSILFIFTYIFNNNHTLVRITKIMRYVVTLGLTLTFLVAMFILPKLTSYNVFEMMINNEFLFFHTLCPLVSTMSFLFFEDYSVTSFESRLVPLATVIYGAIVLLLNIFKLIEGPYPFFMLYNNGVWYTTIYMIIITSSCYLMSFLLGKMKLFAYE